MVSLKKILTHHEKHEKWIFLFVSVAEQLIKWSLCYGM
jgi:hypothetical protein